MTPKTNTLKNRCVSTRWLNRVLKSGLAELGFSNAKVEVLFVSAQKMRALNRRYRYKDYATDVLSFPLLDTHNGKLKKNQIPIWTQQVDYPLGSLVICLSVAEKQARTYQVSFLNEVLRLVVHGLCHLVGYDHERSAKDEQIMFKKEDTLIRKIQR